MKGIIVFPKRSGRPKGSKSKSTVFSGKPDRLALLTKQFKKDKVRYSKKSGNVVVNKIDKTYANLMASTFGVTKVKK